MRLLRIGMLVTLSILALVGCTVAQNPCAGGKPTVYDAMATDENLIFIKTWADNSGASAILASPLTNITIFLPIDELSVAGYTEYVGFPPDLSATGVGYLPNNGPGTRDDSAAAYSSIVGYNSDESKLIAARTINSLWGLAENIDAPLNFTQDTDGSLLINGIGNTSPARVLYKTETCNGVIYAIDTLLRPAPTADGVPPVDDQALARWRVAVLSSVACSDSLLKVAEKQGFADTLRSVWQGDPRAEEYFAVLDDPTLAITLMLPSDSFAESLVEAFAMEQSNGNETLAAAIIRENRLYASLPGKYCPSEFETVNSTNSLLGASLGQDLPLEFEIRNNAATGLQEFIVYGTLQDVLTLPPSFQVIQNKEHFVVEKFQACNSELWIVESMPMMLAATDPVLQAKSEAVITDALQNMRNVSLPARYLTCNQQDSDGDGTASSQATASPSSLALGLGIGLGSAVILLAATSLFITHRRRKNSAALLDTSSKRTAGSFVSDIENASGASNGTDRTAGGHSDRVKTVVETLSQSDAVISPADRIQFVQRPDGSDWVLGRGSWGIVRRALKDGVQPVAVKTLPRLEDLSGGHESAFARECKLLSKLRDPNVVQFIGIVPTADSLMLVTELMEGGDLRVAMTNDTEGKLRWYGAGRSIALDVARALTYLHSQKCVHRDIKTKNILLDASGKAKLADVGLARMLEETATSSFSDGITGTFPFCAPELLMGERCTSKVDIYSFGVCLWEIITSEKAVRGQLRPLKAPDDCPEQAIQLFLRCTNGDPAKRPTAREVYGMLASLSDQTPPEIAKPADESKTKVLVTQFTTPPVAWTEMPNPWASSSNDNSPFPFVASAQSSGDKASSSN